MKQAVMVSFAVVVFSAGCASFDGRGLVPGRSDAADVEALMGAPAEKLARPNGETTLYFSRQPAGRSVYAVTLGPDGVMKSIEQRLTYDNIREIAANVWTKKEVRELLGPPADSGRLAFLPREWWGYRHSAHGDKRVLWVQFSDDGVVREVLDMLDPEFVRPSGS